MLITTDTAAPHSKWPRELAAGDITGAIIGSFFEVYHTLGPGFLESVYWAALEVEFQIRGIRYIREFPLTVYYKGTPIGTYRADFFVESQVILEVKAGKRAQETSKEQLLHYLKGTKTEVGLALKFGTKAEFDRVINSQKGRGSAEIS